MGHLLRSAHQHICILHLTNELKPGSDKLQGYSCELQRVTLTVRSTGLMIIDFNGSHEHPIFFSLIIKMDLPRVLQCNQSSSAKKK
jgi:DNA-binding LacI/PurR family transcriptional regulator